jgi:hypothetical protein
MPNLPPADRAAIPSYGYAAVGFSVPKRAGLRESATRRLDEIAFRF